MKKLTLAIIALFSLSLYAQTQEGTMNSSTPGSGNVNEYDETMQSTPSAAGTGSMTPGTSSSMDQQRENEERDEELEKSHSHEEEETSSP